ETLDDLLEPRARLLVDVARGDQCRRGKLDDASSQKASFGFGVPKIGASPCGVSRLEGGACRVLPHPKQKGPAPPWERGPCERSLWKNQRLLNWNRLRAPG